MPPDDVDFQERFNRTVVDEFYRIAFRQKLFESVEALQRDFDKWLEEYNYERPHLDTETKAEDPGRRQNCFFQGIPSCT